MSAGVEIQIIAVLAAAGCALPGVFLVLRKMSMVSDSITHTILLGIVLAFFVTQDLSSPFLLVGAAAIGVLTVWLTELAAKTRLVSEDSATGLVFPLLFSVAIILITRYAGSVHLDTDSVLLGELAFAPFERIIVFGVDIGAKGIYVCAVIFLMNLVFSRLFLKELTLSAFDPVLGTVIGISPVIFHYALMGMVSLTTVGAFEAVGSVLVVAFMIAPPSAAYLLTDNLKKMIGLSIFFAGLSAVLGYHAAVFFDVSIAGMMAVITGLIFLISFLFAPKRGLISDVLKKKQQKEYFSDNALLLKIEKDSNVTKDNKRLSKLEQDGLITINQGVNLTKKGEKQIAKVKKEWFPV